MSTLSVPLTPRLEEDIKNLVKKGFAPTKAEVVRRAITRLSEEEAVQDVLLARKEIRDGKWLRGDLRKLMNRI